MALVPNPVTNMPLRCCQVAVKEHFAMVICRLYTLFTSHEAELIDFQVRLLSNTLEIMPVFRVKGAVT